MTLAIRIFRYILNWYYHQKAKEIDRWLAVPGRMPAEYFDLINQRVALDRAFLKIKYGLDELEATIHTRPSEPSRAGRMERE